MAVFHCEACGLTREVPDALTGKKAKCPQCREVVTIARAEDAVAGDSGPGIDPESARPESDRQDRDTASPHPSDSVQNENLPNENLPEQSAAPSGPSPHEDSDRSEKQIPPISVDDLAPEPLEDLSRKAPAIVRDDSTAPPDIPLELDSPAPPGEAAVPLMQGDLPRNIFAGIMSGLLSIIFCLAMGTLVFAGLLPGPYINLAFSLALLSAAVIGFATSLLSSIPFVIAAPEAASCASLFLMVSSIGTALQGSSPETSFATICASIAVTTIVTGGILGILGRLREAELIRSVPYQVLGGVMAAMGFFIIKGAWTLLVTANPCIADFSGLLSLETCSSWLPALLFGLFLSFTNSRFRHPLFLLGAIGAAMGLTYGGMHYVHLSSDAATRAGLLFGQIEGPGLLDIYRPDVFYSIDWRIIGAHTSQILITAGLVCSAIMLKVTDIEVKTGTIISLNKESRGLGLANLLSGVLGGFPGAYPKGRSLSHRTFGAAGPVAGIVAAAVCASAIPFAGEILSFTPRFVPAGLLIFIGVMIMLKWLVETRTLFTYSSDYILLVLTFATIMGVGLQPGIGIALTLAMLVLIGRFGRIDVVKNMLSGSSYRSNVERGPRQLEVLRREGGCILILRLQGFMHLGSTNELMHIILSRINSPGEPELKYLVMDFSRISGLGSTGALSFTRLKHLAASQGITTIFTNVTFETVQSLEHGGCLLEDPDQNSRAFVNLDYALEWCENNLLEANGLLAPRGIALEELLENVFPEPDFIPGLLRILERVDARKGQFIFRQGDESDAMYLLAAGMVNVQLELEGGKTVRLKKMRPGAVVGEMGIYTTAPRSASVVATEPCTLYRLSRRTLNEIQGRDPAFAEAVNRYIVGLLASRVSDANTMVRDLLM